MARNGPVYRSEKAPSEDDNPVQKYSKPRKGAEIKCLGCKYGQVLGPGGVVKDCEACKGNGTITVK